MTIVGEAFVLISPEGAGFASKLESQLKTAGLSNAGLALGAGLAGGILVGLGAIGEQFDKVRHQIQQETGATGADLTRLASTVTGAFREVPVSLGAAATAVDQLFRRGVPLGPQLDKLAEQELFLAKVTKEDLGANVAATTALMQRFNVPLTDQSRELDVLFKGYQASGQSLSALTSALQSGGLTLQAFGFDLDHSTALLANLEKHGANLQPILAGLRLAFGKITGAGGDPAKVLAALVKEFSDGTPIVKASADAINLFGKRSGAELVQQLKAGNFSAATLFRTITDGKGGIVATGLATLTLGDQVKLLRNNIEANLSGLGTTVLHDFESGFEAAGPPIEALVASIAHLVTAVAPAAGELLVLLAPLKLLPPLVGDLAAGVGAVATGLGVLPAPLLAIAGAAAIGAFALNAYSTASLLAVRASIALHAAIEFATGPIGLAVGALTLLGVAVREFNAADAVTVKTAKDIGAALFDAGNKTGIFKTGIESAAVGLRQFFAEEAQAGKIKGDLKSTLDGAGISVRELAAHVTSGERAWETYRDSVAKAANDKAFPGFSGQTETANLALRHSVTALNEQRDAFIKAAQTELANAVTAGQLTQAQEKHLESTNRNRDGSINYAAALDALNERLAKNVVAHNQVVAAAVSTKNAEADLADQLAAGTLTDAAAKVALQALGFTGDEVSAQLDKLKAKAVELNQVHDAQVNKTLTTSAAYGNLARSIAEGAIVEADAETKLRAMGLSADGAKAAFSGLQSQINTFVSGALSQIPTLSSAIADLASQTSSDTSSLQSDLAQQQTLRDQLGAHIVSGQQSVASQLASVNSRIALDEHNISSARVSTTTTLDRDVARRTLILQQAAVKSGQASASEANAIAANNKKIHDDYARLAADNDPNTFTKNVLTNAATVATFLGNLQKLVDEGFGPLAGALAAQGPKAAGALAAGLASDPAKAKVAEQAQEISNNIATKYRSFLEQKFPELNLDGAAAGGAIGAGIAAGITGKTPAVLAAVDKIGTDIFVHINNQWKISSPSKVTFSQGAFIGQGLADGILSASGAVRAAGTDLRTAFEKGFGAGRPASTAPLLSEPVRQIRSVVTSAPPPTIQTLPADAPQNRLDARAQQDAAQAAARGRGIFDGAIIQFPQLVEPDHIAAALAWKFLT